MEVIALLTISLTANLGLLVCFSAWKAASMVSEDTEGEGPEGEGPEEDLEEQEEQEEVNLVWFPLSSP